MTPEPFPTVSVKAEVLVRRELDEADDVNEESAGEVLPMVPTAGAVKADVSPLAFVNAGALPVVPVNAEVNAEVLPVMLATGSTAEAFPRTPEMGVATGSIADDNGVNAVPTAPVATEASGVTAEKTVETTGATAFSTVLVTGVRASPTTPVAAPVKGATTPSRVLDRPDTRGLTAPPKVVSPPRSASPTEESPAGRSERLAEMSCRLARGLTNCCKSG